VDFTEHVFFLPLFCIFPFFIAAGITALFAARCRWWFGPYPKRKRSKPYDSDPCYEEKSKRGLAVLVVNPCAWWA
jgi:hypothetical protein